MRPFNQLRSVLFWAIAILFLLTTTTTSMADLGLDTDDFEHKKVSGKNVDGKRVDGKPVTGTGIHLPDDPDPDDDPNDDGPDGDPGDESPTCQSESDNAIMEGDSCKKCGDSTATSCNPDTCQQSYSHINLFTRQYQDDKVDMKVKAPGGHIKLFRIYTEEKWQFGHEFNRLDLSKIENGTIEKSNLTYTKEEDGLFHYRDFTIEQKEKSYRWENKWGSYVLYNTAGRIVETGDRVGVLALYHYSGEKLVSINDRRDSPIFHFTYTNTKITSVNDEHDREVHYTWDGDKLTAVKDVLGYSTTYTYDDNNRLTTKADEADRKFFITYFKDGAVKSVKSKMGGGNTLSYSHDKDSDEYYAKATSAMGKAKEYWFDNKGETKRVMVNGNLTRKIEWSDGKKTITNEIGSRSVQSYDQNNNLIREDYSDGTFKSFGYDSNNNLISKINENGVENRYSYTQQGLKKSSRVAYQTPEEQLTEYSYGQEGNLLSQTIFNNTQPIATRYTHDEKGNLIRTTNALGAETEFSYDFMGNVVKSTNGIGLSITMTHDKKGNPITSTTSNQQTISYSYDPAGRRIEVSDSEGAIARYVYDAQDNLREQVDGLGSTKMFNFDKDDRLTKKVDEEGNYSVFFYEEGSERISKIIDGMGNETKFTYRGFENCGSCSKTFSKNPVLIQYPTFSRQISYDAQGRVTEQSDILEGKYFTERFEYDKVGNVLSSTDQAGRVTQREYDNLSRPVAETDPLGNITRKEYDTLGNLTQLTDAKGQKTTFEYDILGRKTKEIRPLGNTLTFSYDATGRLLSRTDSKGQQVSYVYDEKNGYLETTYLKRNEADFPGKPVKYSYDKHGRMAGYDDGTTSASYEYDRLGRRIKEQLNYGDFEAAHSYTYYRNGHKKSYQGPDGITHTYSYNQINKLEKIDIENVGTISYSNYTWLQPQTTTFPGGQKLDRYDGFLRLTERKSSNSKGENILNLAYKYNETNTIISKSTADSITNYDYDELQRLVGVQNNNTTTESFKYDLVGNRLSSNNYKFNYDNNNQLLAVNETTYRYDENGSPISIQTGTDEKTLSYTIENRLESYSAKGTEAKYYYDPFGRRLSKRVNGKLTWFYYTEDGLTAEFDHNGKLLTSYSYRPSTVWTTDPIMTSRSGSHYFYHNDHLGAPYRLTDANGKIVWQAAYNSFGQVKVEKEVVLNNLRFPGQYFDSGSGLYYNWNRYYDPNTGRYISMDPLGVNGGINLYSYAEGDPVNYYDEDGKKKKKPTDIMKQIKCLKAISEVEKACGVSNGEKLAKKHAERYEQCYDFMKYCYGENIKRPPICDFECEDAIGWATGWMKKCAGDKWAREAFDNTKKCIRKIRNASFLCRGWKVPPGWK